MSTEYILNPILDTFKEEFEKLHGKLSSEGLSGKTFQHFLSKLKAAVNKVGADALVGAISSFDDEKREIVQDGKIHRFKSRSNTSWLTIFGQIQIERRLYQPDRGGNCLIPLDQACGMKNKFMTPDVEEACAYGSGQLPAKEVRQFMKKVLPKVPSVTAIRKVATEVGAFLETQAEALESRIESKKPLSEKGDILAVSVDGVMAPIRQLQCQQEDVADTTENSKYSVSWKEAGVCSISTYESEEGTDEVRLDRVDTRYLARMPEPKMETLYERLNHILEKTMSKRDYNAYLVLCDGKLAIWSTIESMPVFKDFIFVLDFYHASGYLRKASDALFGEGTTESDNWFTRYRSVLRDEKEGIDKVIQSIRYFQKKFRRRGKNREAIETVLNYYKRNKGKMHYGELREMGYPIGSGVVEAACKTVVGRRMKQSGMRWTHEGGQKIMNLRTLILSERWDVSWKMYLEKGA